MPGPVRAADVVVGLLTENTPRMLAQAIRLLRSIRWFGGELAAARVVVCGVGPLESEARATLEALGAEVRSVSRFHLANPAANRHQLIAELLEEPEEILFVLDCDTIVVRDPLPYLVADSFQAKVAPTPTVSDDVFERLFAHFGLEMPPRSRIASFTGTPMIPYFNAGVLVIPKTLARTLAPVWRRYNRILADNPELVAPCQRHMHQASMALALAETGLPCVDLPAAMNYQINAAHVAPPAGYAETDPVIIHYHQLATDDGFLLPSSYPGAQARIEMFHSRMRAEGFAPEPPPAGTRESRPIFVLGMHRSGTSVVAQILNALGVYAGRPDELAPPDIFNPTGFWEHNEVAALNRQILQALGATWVDSPRADISRLSGEQRAGYVGRARRIVARSLQGRGPFLIKDPRISLLFPLWREALQNPVCVIAWRDPMAVARSLATRDKRPHLGSLAAWEHYTRTLLRDTEGVPRVLVSYEELLVEPARITRELHAALTGFGIEGLSLPSDERIRQFVNTDFNRSGRGASTDDTLLDDSQRALLADLSSGAALREPVAPTPARTVELLAEFGEIDVLRQDIIERDERISIRDRLLNTVFESKSWRIGHRLTGLLRFLRRSSAVSAEDRWREMTRKRNG
ncbi:MAG TPA: sulfotransferase [Thermoanaerobaculia bacterium]|nr:sulfotransferase [Thermoanaerobaculia bacterium]